MAWVKIDDGFWSNPKVRKAGPCGAGVYVMALSYCGQYLTDGTMPEEIWQLFGNKWARTQAIEAELVRLENGNVLIPDFLDFNPSADEVKRRRAIDLQRKRQARGAKLDKQEEALSERTANGQTDVVRLDVRAPSALPVPSPSPPTEKEKGRDRSKPRTAPTSPTPDGARPANEARPEQRPHEYQVTPEPVRTKAKPWHCPYCTTNFASEDELYRHIVQCEP